MQEGIHKVLLRVFHIISLTDGVLRTRGWEGVGGVGVVWATSIHT